MTNRLDHLERPELRTRPAPSELVAAAHAGYIGRAFGCVHVATTRDQGGKLMLCFCAKCDPQR